MRTHHPHTLNYHHLNYNNGRECDLNIISYHIHITQMQEHIKIAVYCIFSTIQDNDVSEK